MAGLWMTVMLAFLLSGPSAAVDKNKLAKFIQHIKTEYAPKTPGIFSLAVSIPGGNENGLNQVFHENPNSSVKKAISNGAVYKGDRLALAKVAKPEHAELRVLKDLKLSSSKGDLLVIYSSSSSCPTTCTNINSDYNIIKEINNVINKGRWSEYAFVFEKVFMPRNTVKIKESLLIKALKELGKSRINLKNIFRCYKPDNNNFECISCSNNGNVTEQCVKYNE